MSLLLSMLAASIASVSPIAIPPDTLFNSKSACPSFDEKMVHDVQGAAASTNGGLLRLVTANNQKALIASPSASCVLVQPLRRRSPDFTIPRF